MKRYIIYFTAVAAMFMAASCVQEPEVPFVTDLSQITFEPEGGEVALKLSVGEDWVAMTNEPWVSFSPANGKGSEVCRIKVDSTLLFDTRDDVIRIRTASGDDREIEIFQNGFQPCIAPAKSLVELEDFAVREKRKFKIDVLTNVDFENPVPRNHPWLTCKKSALVLDRGARPRNVTLEFEWKVNPNADLREEDIKIEVEKDGTPVQTSIKIKQAGAPDIESKAGTAAGDSLALLSISRFLGCWSEYDAGMKMERWEGVEIWESGENKGRVKSAKFVFFETDESLPYAVKYLTAAEELYFYSNVNSFMKSLSLGEDICELSNLKRLTLFAYGLTELPDKMENMTNLRYLDLTANNFDRIPKVLQKCDSLKALLLTSNQRSVVNDLSNTVKKELGGLINETPADGNGKRKFPEWLLEWNTLDTLRLSVNFLQGTLPTDAELMATGKFKAWDPEAAFDEKVSEVCIKDSLGAAGVQFFKENEVPMVLPDIDFFSINLNRLHGDIPHWLKYHPKLDFWAPLLLVFPQEGKDASGTPAGFTNEPTNLNYYYEIFEKKAWSEINTID